VKVDHQLRPQLHSKISFHSRKAIISSNTLILRWGIELSITSRWPRSSRPSVLGFISLPPVTKYQYQPINQLIDGFLESDDVLSVVNDSRDGISRYRRVV
jgi:hypothetical protein